MTGKFAKIMLILIAITDALVLNIVPKGPIFDIAMRVLLFFVALLPILGAGCLLKLLCCCKKN